jgi:hypothetical protein
VRHRRCFQWAARGRRAWKSAKEQRGERP